MSKLIKWSGSKDSQSEEIIKYIPDIKIYNEPFVGGGSIFLTLLKNRKNIKYYISDLNRDLINIYLTIQTNPKKLIDKYNYHYINFNGGDIQERKDYFNKVRESYNLNRCPLDFYWIMRTTTNGMPRYNKNGDFNNSCHFSRPGMMPEKVKDIILEYHELFNDNDIIFRYGSYDDFVYDDFVYLDPPYENTKTMYYSKFDNSKFINWLNKLECKWILSYDGKVNDDIQFSNKPNYKNEYYIKSGNSSFRRVVGKSKDSMVYEKIYISY